jgi:7-keto-8-aminopelargonate synthetase-like enzyme
MESSLKQLVKLSLAVALFSFGQGLIAVATPQAGLALRMTSQELGVLGTGGRGILQDQALADFEGIYTASLGKALANVGGVIAGKRALIEALRYSCPGLIYSTALPPVCAAGSLRALEIIGQDFAALGRALWQNHRQLAEKLAARGFQLQ